jgi:hypothetical protein
LFWKARVDNPVLRHTVRITSSRRLGWIVAGILLLALTATGLLQQYWLQYSVYAGRPRIYVRWFYLFVLAEVLVVLPWSALRGAVIWRQLETDGHLDEYRRSRLSPLAIVAGALYGALRPGLWFLGLSAALGLAAAILNGGGAGGAAETPTALETIAAHGLLLVLAFAFAALGQLLVNFTRSPALAMPFCMGLLAIAAGGIWCLNPYYRTMTDPDLWIWRVLLPNPVVAEGTLLRIDLLRSSWVYDRIRAVDYFSIGFMYPPPVLTAALYAGLGAFAVSLTAWRLARREGS